MYNMSKCFGSVKQKQNEDSDQIKNTEHSWRLSGLYRAEEIVVSWHTWLSESLSTGSVVMSRDVFVFGEDLPWCHDRSEIGSDLMIDTGITITLKSKSEIRRKEEISQFTLPSGGCWSTGQNYGNLTSGSRHERTGGVDVNLYEYCSTDTHNT